MTWPEQKSNLKLINWRVERSTRKLNRFWMRRNFQFKKIKREKKELWFVLNFTSVHKTIRKWFTCKQHKPHTAHIHLHKHHEWWAVQNCIHILFTHGLHTHTSTTANKIGWDNKRTQSAPYVYKTMYRHANTNTLCVVYRLFHKRSVCCAEHSLHCCACSMKKKPHINLSAVVLLEN